MIEMQPEIVAKDNREELSYNKSPECFLPFAGNIPGLQMHASGVNKEGEPKAALFAGGWTAAGLQSGYEKKKFCWLSGACFI